MQKSVRDTVRDATLLLHRKNSNNHNKTGSVSAENGSPPVLSNGETKVENIIIAVVIATLIAIAVFYSVNHFKGKGGCCGGGTLKTKKKKLPRVFYQKTFKVQGMHCENCKARVEETVNDIDGISGKVNLKSGELTVSYAKDVSDDTIRVKLERLGYIISK